MAGEVHLICECGKDKPGLYAQHMAIDALKKIASEEICDRTVVLYPSSDNGVEAVSRFVEVAGHRGVNLHRRRSHHRMNIAGNTPVMVNHLGEFLDRTLQIATFGDDRLQPDDPVIALTRAPLITAFAGLDSMEEVREDEVYTVPRDLRNPNYDPELAKKAANDYAESLRKLSPDIRQSFLEWIITSALE